MVDFLKNLGRDESGATAIEYGLIAALIFFAMVGAVQAFGEGAIDMWTDITTAVVTATGA
ncbi:Flp family type IVb pilin [Qipengyuania sp. G39]|uniref:Flp family type IVb pilin n=1 Tax=Qipengyuania profundimaris TaxID=3067652 RepID=A0ABT9HQK1_9SPHN|nr:Flp family type IVb pilin [Qipengyuania sp. G39]MDP4575013.1 Flp family type IVb pilin [Qipengyuania sp. G39]